MKPLLPLFLLSYTLLNAEQSPTTHSIIEEPDKLVFNFQYRGRFDIYDGVNKLAYGDDAIDAKGNVRGESDDTIYVQQIIAGFTYRPDDDWTLKASMYDARSWGSSLDAGDFVKNPGTPDAYVMSFYDDHLELFETYIRRYNLLNKNLTLTLGRQQLGYGDRRIFGPGLWGNTMGWLWDASHLSYKEGKNFIDVWYGQTRTKEENDFSIKHKHRFQGMGLYGHYEFSDMKIEPFMAWRNNLHHTVVNEADLYYVGARVYDNENPGFIYDATLVKEEGDTGTLDVDAYACAVKAGYYFDNKYKMKFLAGFIYATGDEDPNDNVMQTFSAPFGANDGLHYGRMDIMFWSNMEDIQASFSFKPTNKLFIETAYHHFNLAEANDKWYLFGYKNKPGNSYTHIGDEIDLIVKYKLTPSIDLLGIYSYLNAGDFITKNDIAQNNSSKTFLQFMYKW